MEKVVHISLVPGDKSVDLTAPAPSGQQPTPQPVQTHEVKVPENTKFSEVSVTLVGCGGCGINLSRPFKDNPNSSVLFFDTSMTNSRPGEYVNIVTNGSGSGSNRATNAKDIESSIPKLTEEELGNSDVAVVLFSLAGGSGSVIAPLLIREYARRNRRVIGVCIADTSYSVGAKNTLNTLKTLTAVAKNNDLYLPMVILSNDLSTTRGAVDTSAILILEKIIKILSTEVYEVDRNDRLNWINPKTLIGSNAGLKLMTFYQEDSKINDALVMGTNSTEMVDALLVLQNSPDDEVTTPLPMARLKKTGFFLKERHRLVGKVSSDISAVDSVIDYVEKMINAERAQKHSSLGRLDNTGDDDLVI